MYCRNCGRQVINRAMTCVSCGAMPANGSLFCWNCGSPTDSTAEVCVQCGAWVSGAGRTELKSRIAAGLLGIFFGGLGLHRFYLGYIGIGIAQIALTILTGFGGIWGLIEGILILAGRINRDARGLPLRG